MTHTHHKTFFKSLWVCLLLTFTFKLILWVFFLCVVLKKNPNLFWMAARQFFTFDHLVRFFLALPFVAQIFAIQNSLACDCFASAI